MKYSKLVESSNLAVTLARNVLDTLARAYYKQEEGYPLTGALPQKDPLLDYDRGEFYATIDPNEKQVYNFQYNERMITVRSVCEYTDHFVGISSDLIDLWDETYNERYQKRDVPEGLDRMDEVLEQAERQRGFVLENPQLDDFLTTVRKGHSHNAARMLNADYQAIFAPGGDHELNGLFTNGTVHVIYRDNDIALLKPEYNHETTIEVMNQQTPGQRVTAIEVTEAAYVVGVDDTPVGLFGHIVDGTNLHYDKDVTRSQIHEVMGFDHNYFGEQRISMDTGERLRLQGDLAIRKMDKVKYRRDTPDSQCNLPIDNHLVVIGGGFVTGDRGTEPITVQVPEPTTMSVLHDEHEQVNCEIPEGEYEFYLLTRGVQDDHPEW